MINSGYPLSLENPDKKNLIHIISESGDYCVANYCISALQISFGRKKFDLYLNA